MTTPTGKPSRGHGSKYLLVRDQAVLALVTHGDSQKASEEIGVPARTLRGWMCRQDFQETLEQVQRTLRAEASAHLTGYLKEALERLKYEAEHARKAADRIRAIRTLTGLEQRFEQEKMKECLAAVQRELAEVRRYMGNTYIHSPITITPEAFKA